MYKTEGEWHSSDLEELDSTNNYTCSYQDTQLLLALGLTGKAWDIQKGKKNIRTIHL